MVVLLQYYGTFTRLLPNSGDGCLCLSSHCASQPRWQKFVQFILVREGCITGLLRSPHLNTPLSLLGSLVGLPLSAIGLSLLPFASQEDN